MYSILLIDDSPDLLRQLSDTLRELVPEDEAQIIEWVPSKDEGNPKESFDGRITNETVLVVTDYDLTTGKTGLFGTSIVNWCQARAIPVGNYTRGHVGDLPSEPNLFELRVPTNPEKGARYIASIFRGFRWIKEQLKATKLAERKNSPAGVLAELLKAPQIESQFSLYGTRLGTTNAALLERIVHTAADPQIEEKESILGYIVGHLLLNSILRFPGPIISDRALAAYVSCAESEIDSLMPLFSSAVYEGPFCDLTRYFWLHKIDDELEVLTDCLPDGNETETLGQLYREAIELEIKRALTKHDCKICDGINGGFLCPFTEKTVCQKEECSVGASSLVPPGASLCRIQRDFYDEWAPILGI